MEKASDNGIMKINKLWGGRLNMLSINERFHTAATLNATASADLSYVHRRPDLAVDTGHEDGPELINPPTGTSPTDAKSGRWISTLKASFAG